MACSKRGGLVVGALVGLVAVVAVHFGMAYATLSTLNSARERGDADAFSAKVDYPALRASFKTTMGENLDATAQATPAIVRPMVQAMNKAILGTLTDHLITPEGVAQIMAQGKVPTPRQVDEQGQTLPGNRGGAGPDAHDGPPPVVTHFRDLSTLAVTYDDGHGRTLTLLVKAQAPFTWKLAGIEIPVPDAIKAAVKAQVGQPALPASAASAVSALAPSGTTVVPVGVASETSAASSTAGH